MLLRLFAAARAAGVPVTIGEHMDFLAALRAEVVLHDVDGFYHLARAAMVKDERHVDRFDRAFAEVFGGLEGLSAQEVLAAADLPADWLERHAERLLTPAERAEIEAMGGFEALMDALRERLRDQEGRHEGGSKWIGTAGTSPFGAHGYNPEGVRIGQDRSRHGRAAKVWDRREFRDLDDTREMGTRAMRVALKRLRAWARDGAERELDLEATVRSTARSGLLDVRTRPERRNAARVLLMLDVGGSMDPHVEAVEALFSAARAEFRSLHHWYFHNCLYEGVWADNRRRWDATTPTEEVLATHGPETRVIFVGDAAMAPYEVTHPGGANEHWNAQSGAAWLARARARWPLSVWINPLPEAHWPHTPTVGMIREIFDGRMMPLTLEGITSATRALTR